MLASPKDRVRRALAMASLLGLIVGTTNAQPVQDTPSDGVAGSNPQHTNLAWRPVDGASYPDARILRVAYLPATHDALLFIAIREGLFHRVGLNLDARRYTNSPAALAALESGEVDLAIPGIAAPFYRIASGGPLVVLGGEAWYSAGIVATPDFVPKQVGSARQLLIAFRGKTIATITKSTGDAILRAKLFEAVLSNDVSLRAYQSPVQAMSALESGEVDAAMLWSPHMTTIERRTKGRFVTVVWASQLQKHPCCRQIATAKTTRAKREALVRYMSGIILAKRFMADRANQQRVLDAVGNYVKASPDLLRQELFDIDPRAKHRRTEVSPNNGPDQVRKYAEMMRDAKLISPNAVGRIERSIDVSILTDAYRRVYPVLSEEEAKDCAARGLEPCERIQQLQPLLPIRN